MRPDGKVLELCQNEDVFETNMCVDVILFFMHFLSF